LDGKFTALAQRLAEQLPRAALQLVPDAGHDLLLERPELITEVIRRGNPT
jgi:pimeloyl-ACP methyl ester carboxylesterase